MAFPHADTVAPTEESLGTGGPAVGSSSSSDALHPAHFAALPSALHIPARALEREAFGDDVPQWRDALSRCTATGVALLRRMGEHPSAVDAADTTRAIEEAVVDFNGVVRAAAAVRLRLAKDVEAQRHFLKVQWVALGEQLHRDQAALEATAHEYAERLTVAAAAEAGRPMRALDAIYAAWAAHCDAALDVLPVGGDVDDLRSHLLGISASQSAGLGDSAEQHALQAATSLQSQLVYILKHVRTAHKAAAGVPLLGEWVQRTASIQADVEAVGGEVHQWVQGWRRALSRMKSAAGAQRQKLHQDYIRQWGSHVSRAAKAVMSAMVRALRDVDALGEAVLQAEAPLGAKLEVLGTASSKAAAARAATQGTSEWGWRVNRMGTGSAEAWFFAARGDLRACIAAHRAACEAAISMA